ncbi:unnamed protein product [Boreogadus saida]
MPPLAQLCSVFPETSASRSAYNPLLMCVVDASLLLRRRVAIYERADVPEHAFLSTYFGSVQSNWLGLALVCLSFTRCDLIVHFQAISKGCPLESSQVITQMYEREVEVIPDYVLPTR